MAIATEEIRSEPKPGTVTWKAHSVSDKQGNKGIYVFINYKESAQYSHEDKFIFEVYRHKRVDKTEYFVIKCFEVENWVKDNDSELKIAQPKNEILAEVQSSLKDLESNFKAMREYGVILDQKHYPKICRIIEHEYYSLSVIQDENTDTDTVTLETVKAVFGMFVDYIVELNIDDKDGLYNIPVTEFKEHLDGSKYSEFKYSDLRDGLARLYIKAADGKSEKCTKCSFGRNDNTIVGDDKKKRVKVISFVSAMVQAWKEKQQYAYLG